MEMFLMILTMSVFCFAVACVAFGAATNEEHETQVVRSMTRPSMLLPLSQPGFFVNAAQTSLAGPAAHTQVPLDVLLLQIEQHVRLEQAAAESFLDAPTTASLHSRTTSPLVH